MKTEMHYDYANNELRIRLPEVSNEEAFKVFWKTYMALEDASSDTLIENKILRSLAEHMRKELGTKKYTMEQKKEKL